MDQVANEVNSINADTPYWIRRIFTEMHGRRDYKYRDTLVALAMHSNKHGRCFPSIKTLAPMCGLTYAGMKRRLTELEEMGLIRRIARAEKNGRQTSNGYVLLPRINTALPVTAVASHTERTKETPVGQVSENAKPAAGTTGVQSNQPQPLAAPLLASQEEIWHVASTWRWWFPRTQVVPVEGEPRPVGTVVSVVENARETCGSSFLAHLFGAADDDLPDGDVAP